MNGEPPLGIKRRTLNLPPPPDRAVHLHTGSLPHTATATHTACTAVGPWDNSPATAPSTAGNPWTTPRDVGPCIPEPYCLSPWTSHRGQMALPPPRIDPRHTFELDVYTAELLSGACACMSVEVALTGTGGESGWHPLQVLLSKLTRVGQLKRALGCV